MALRILSDCVGTLRSYFGLKPASSSGAPSSGTYAKGAEYCDADGARWHCIAGGTPGTWLRASQTADVRARWLTNYCTNADAEEDTTGWTTYADAAGFTPVDMTGGSPSITWTRSTSSPIAGAAHFLFTKDAANRQGNGVAFAATIPAFEQGKALEVRIRARLVSGSYTTEALSFAAYDVTNGALITVQSGQLSRLIQSIDSGGVSLRYRFVVPSGCTSVRVGLHVYGSDSTAYTVAVDDVWITPHVGSNVAITEDVTNRSTTSSSATDTGVSVTLLHPLRSTASRVKLSARGVVGHSSDNSVRAFEIRRDTTSIIPSGVNAHQELHSGGLNTTVDTLAIDVIDTPGAVAQAAYRLYWSRSNAGTAYLGRRGTDTAIDSPTTMLAEEIIDEPIGGSGGTGIEPSATSFTLTITGSSSNPSKGTSTAEKCYCLQIGRVLHVWVMYYHDGAGSAGSGDYLFAIPIPSGWQVDTNVHESGTGDTGSGSAANSAAVLGSGYAGSGSSMDYRQAQVALYNSTNVGLLVSQGGTDTNLRWVDSGYFQLSTSRVAYSFHYCVVLQRT